MEVSGQLHASAALSQGKSPSYPLDRRLGGPRSRSGHGGEEKNSQPLPGLEPPIIKPKVRNEGRRNGMKEGRGKARCEEVLNSEKLGNVTTCLLNPAVS
jgi:hypothetical protein